MHPEILSLFLFMLGTSCSPGPNNIVASYSSFNFGIIKTFPHMLGVIIGFTTMVCVVNFGLINIFKIYPIIQEILKITGSVFLIYLAYKIAGRYASSMLSISSQVAQSGQPLPFGINDCGAMCGIGCFCRRSCCSIF